MNNIFASFISEDFGSFCCGNMVCCMSCMQGIKGVLKMIGAELVGDNNTHKESQNVVLMLRFCFCYKHTDNSPYFHLIFIIYITLRKLLKQVIWRAAGVRRGPTGLHLPDS